MNDAARALARRLTRNLNDAAKTQGRRGRPYQLHHAKAGMLVTLEGAGHGDCPPLWAGQDASGCRAMPAEHRARELAG